MRTLLELLRLLARSFTRAKLPGRKEQASSAFILRILLVGGLVFQGWNAGRVISRGAVEISREIGWIAVGVAITAFAAGVLVALPFFRGGQPLLRHPFLATLPIGETARTTAEIASLYVLYGYAAATAFAARGAAAAPYAVAVAVAFATLGNGALRLARRWISASSIGYVRMAATLLLLVGYALPAIKFQLAKSRAFPFVEALGRAWRDDRALGFVVPIVAVALGALAIGWAERRGYDRVDLAPPAKVKAASAIELRLGRVDALLARREPGGRGQWFGYVFSTAIVAVLFFIFTQATKTPRSGDERVLATLPKGAQIYVAFLSFSMVFGLAQRAAARDTTARPLLAPLPIAPRDLLMGRARLLRRRALGSLAPLIALPFLPTTSADRVSLAWHTGLLLVAGWLVAETAGCVAFLSEGIVTPLRSKWTLASYLVFFPIPTLILAERPLQAALPLALVWLTAREARRASLSVVRWLDDDDESARSMIAAPWRALVVFGAFVAAEGLFARTIDALALGWEPGRVALTAYLLAATLLMGLTAAGWGLRGLFGRPWRFERGLALGAFSAIVVVGVNVVLRRFAIATVVLPHGALGAMTALVVEPLVEELFFRGWLQSALVGRARVPAVAIATGAVLFALAHPASSFVPVFVLGLVTGYLRHTTGGVAAGCVAHAIHNAAALFLV